MAWKCTWESDLISFYRTELNSGQCSWCWFPFVNQASKVGGRGRLDLHLGSLGHSPRRTRSWISPSTEEYSSECESNFSDHICQALKGLMLCYLKGNAYYYYYYYFQIGHEGTDTMVLEPNVYSIETKKIQASKERNLVLASRWAVSSKNKMLQCLHHRLKFNTFL